MKKKGLFVFALLLASVVLNGCKNNTPSSSFEAESSEKSSSSEEAISIVEQVVVEFEVNVPKETEQVHIRGSFTELLTLTKSEDNKWIGSVSLEPGTYTYNYYNGDITAYSELNDVRTIYVVSDQLKVKDTVFAWKPDWVAPLSLAEFLALPKDSKALVEVQIEVIYFGVRIAVVDGSDKAQITVSEDELENAHFGVGDIVRINLIKVNPSFTNELALQKVNGELKDTIIVSKGNAPLAAINLDEAGTLTKEKLLDYYLHRANLSNLIVKSNNFGSGGLGYIKVLAGEFEILLAISYDLYKNDPTFKALAVNAEISLNNVLVLVDSYNITSPLLYLDNANQIVIK